MDDGYINMFLTLAAVVIPLALACLLIELRLRGESKRHQPPRPGSGSE